MRREKRIFKWNPGDFVCIKENCYCNVIQKRKKKSWLYIVAGSFLNDADIYLDIHSPRALSVALVMAGRREAISRS